MHETMIKAKLEEELKPIANLCERIEKMLESDFDCGMDNVHVEMAGKSVDMIKDLCEAGEKVAKTCYYKQIIAAMDEAKEEDKKEDEYMLKRIKEEYGDDEEGARRYYDDWRYMRSGRYAPKGKGTYTGRGRSRRGYTEMMPMDYMMPDMYGDDAERMRDLDRERFGRMYYSVGGNSSGGSMGNMSGNRSGSSDNYSGGDRRGYDGDGRRSNFDSGRDYREGRSGQRRRGYMETKEMHSDNSPESKQHRMKELDAYMKELSEDVTEMIGDASAEERALLKQKMQGLVSKL